ncbi:YitT family protein [Metabacillus sp. KIGAM252]|uniref:YitT family protein n=1 Tax=Metabacillus flavus TaxID=2823519 RepID=A0ABS5LJY7_9BACI|nr:YitT family protein [Metabacillus flavus]MBS2970964.1 YitT family protein [Metabacillus flavus]
MSPKILSFLKINIGLIFVAINIHFFLSANNIAAGGTGGLSIVIQHFLPLPVGQIMLMLDGILFVIGFLIIGSAFGAVSLYSSITLSLLVWGFSILFPMGQPMSDDALIELIIGMIIGSFGSALVFSQNASTGGTDIVARIINKFTYMEMGRAVLLADISIVASSAAVFGIQTGMYALLGLLIKGFLIDYAMQMMNENKEVVIISAESEKIKQFILLNLNKGATVHTAKGAFSNDEKEVITTILARREFHRLKVYIQSVDEDAFVTIHNMNEIMGRNFKSFA